MHNQYWPKMKVSGRGLNIQFDDSVQFICSNCKLVIQDIIMGPNRCPTHKRETLSSRQLSRQSIQFPSPTAPNQTRAKATKPPEELRNSSWTFETATKREHYHELSESDQFSNIAETTQTAGPRSNVQHTATTERGLGRAHGKAEKKCLQIAQCICCPKCLSLGISQPDLEKRCSSPSSSKTIARNTEDAEALQLRNNFLLKLDRLAGKTRTDGGKHLQFITIDSDEEEEDDLSRPCAGKLRSSRNAAARESSNDQNIIDLDNYEGLIEEELERIDNQRCRGGRHIPIQQRNPPIVAPYVKIDQAAILNNIVLKAGKTVELDQSDDDLLFITAIIKNVQTDSITLRGHRLQRVRSMNGYFPNKHAELCWCVDVDLDDDRPYFEQGKIEVDIANAVRVRGIKFTNQAFPACSFRTLTGFHTKAQTAQEAPQVVRWIFFRMYATAKDRVLNHKCIEHSLKHLSEEILEVKEIHRVFVEGVDSSRRQDWRGDSILGGAYTESMRINAKRRASVISLDSEMSCPSEQVANNKRIRAATAVDEDPQKKLQTSGKTRAIDLTGDDDPASIQIETERVRRCVSEMSIIEPNSNSEYLDHYDTSTKIFRSGTQFNSPKYSNSVGDLSTPKPPTSVSGSILPTPPHTGCIHIPQSTKDHRKSSRCRQMYTFGDAFCGSGGTTVGARNSGLKVIWGLDKDSSAAATWRYNFPHAKLYEMWADELIHLAARKIHNLRVDILHLSPPCQFFSPAHTVAGKDDEMNSATIFACGPLIDAANPRLLTLEQTFGITHDRFAGYLHSVINMLTSRGFSVRWTVAPLQNWGLPQRRSRLLVIASCPGEVLPEFPPYTHNEDGTNGLKPYTSVDSVLKRIPSNAPNHDLAGAHEYARLKGFIIGPQWDSKRIVPKTITTHGGHNYHPSGKRHFTRREFAALQTFPHDHEFIEPNVMKQIGNAVPPLIAQLLFIHLKKALEKADGIKPEVLLIE